MARPRKEIDQQQFENLCAIQCTEQEICDFFGVTPKTLAAWCRRTYENRRFSQVFAEKRGMGRISLRRSQWKKAHAGDTALLIFLGKNYLAQADKLEQKSEVEMNDVVFYLPEKDKEE